MSIYTTRTTVGRGNQSSAFLTTVYQLFDKQIISIKIIFGKRSARLSLSLANSPPLMRRFFVCTFLALFLLVFSGLQAATGQDEGILDPVNQIGVSSGSGVVASGLDFNAAFSQGPYRFSFRGNNTPRYILKVGRTTWGWLRLDVTGGAYENVPWIGPQATVSQSFGGGSIKSLFWIGWSAGKNNPSLDQTQLMFWQWSSFLSLNLFQLRSEAKNGQRVSLTTSYTYFNFRIVGRDVPQSLVGATLNFPIGEAGAFKLGVGGVKDVLDGPVRLKASITFTPQ